MADFSISEDLYCLSCNTFSPITGASGAALNFSVELDAGNASATSANAIVSDGNVIPAVLAGSTATFTHTFSSPGTYTITMQALFASTSQPSTCDAITVVIS